MGIILPAFALTKVINMLQSLMPESATENAFYLHLAKSIETIETPNKKALLAQAARVIQSQVYPAYQELQEYIKILLNKTDTNNGVWALPDGDAYYTYVLKYQTSTDLTADQIHEIGLQEVEKIQTEMRKILIKAGIYDKTKSVGQQMQELANDPRFFYPKTQDGRHQCLTDFGKILERSRKELYPLFDLKPKLPVKIQPVPQHEEEGVSGACYFPPNIDGSHPGVFLVNPRSAQEEPNFTMETLTVHESEPGHHFQLSLQQESNIPVLRKMGEYASCSENNAYVEGWALYAEKLAYENNFYSSCYTQLGHLQWDLLRAARLVTDTGIHKKRWSRETAIAYLQMSTGLPINQVISEVERYFVFPGQACSYKIGQLKIIELRERAKAILQTKFDIREFHNVVLGVGATPLVVLEEVVDQYIHDTRNA